MREEDWELVSIVSDIGYLKKKEKHGLYGYESIQSLYNALLISRRAGFTSKSFALKNKLNNLLKTAIEK